MSKLIAPRSRRQLVAVGVQRGRDRITAVLAPTLRVVREDGEPRVEFVVPPMPEAA